MGFNIAHAWKCYISVVTCALGICPICMPSALGPVALRLWAYISGKSLVPMLQLILVQYNYIISKNCANRCFSDSPVSIFLTACFIACTALLSTAPSVAGWYGGINFCLIPLFLQKSLKSCAVNCGPLSLTIFLGNPKLAKNSLRASTVVLYSADGG